MFEQYRKKGTFTFSSGKTSEFFYDFDKLSSEDTFFYAFMLEEKFKLFSKNFPFLVTIGYGGIGLGFALSWILKKNLILIEKETLTPRGNLSIIKPNYLIVDDVISTYKTIDKIQSCLKFPAAAAASFIFRGEKTREGFPTYVLANKEVEK